jgi:lactate permease
LSVWAQPLNPLQAIGLSALAAAIPIFLLLFLMGGLRKSGYVSAAWALAATCLVAVAVWRMPLKLALASIGYGAVYALWPIMWIVLAALWLYNLTVDTGKFDLLRHWMGKHASGDMRIQAILVAFCFGALLEGTAGFGVPVAVAAFLLVGLGFSSRKAVTLSLLANTAPVAFGALGIPIVALAAVTGLDQMKLSAMVGRQLPFLSLLIPAFLVLLAAGKKGLRETWPAALIAGGSFAIVQFGVSNYWGPYAADVLASLGSIAALVFFLRFWNPGHPSDTPVELAESRELSASEAVVAWTPWVILAAVMVLWSYLKLFQKVQVTFHVPFLHDAIFITLYHRSYAAIYQFQPLGAGTAALTAVLITTLLLRASPRVLLSAGWKTLRQLLLPGLTVVLIVALAFLYNYSGMAYTLGAALAALGSFFPFVSGYLGWLACFLSGSDTASNLLFGNLQVAAAHRIGVSPILLAATNSSGAVTGKMISPQNIAVGVTTVGLIGHEGEVLRSTFWYSILLALSLSLLAFAQAYWLKWMIP